MAVRKNIDIEEKTLVKLKLLAAFEEVSVKALMESAVTYYVESKEKERLKSMTDEEKEDLGLLMLMQQSERDLEVSREDVLNALR